MQLAAQFPNSLPLIRQEPMKVPIFTPTSSPPVSPRPRGLTKKVILTPRVEEPAKVVVLKPRAMSQEPPSQPWPKRRPQGQSVTKAQGQSVTKAESQSVTKAEGQSVTKAETVTKAEDQQKKASSSSSEELPLDEYVLNDTILAVGLDEECL